MSLWLASRCLASPRFGWGGQRGLEMIDGARAVAVRQRLAAQRQLGAHVLAERAAFAAFPWLETCG